MEPKDIHKLVATTVTSAFVLNNISVEKKFDLNSLAPTLLMDHNQFCVCLYDCVQDVLILSEPIQLFQMIERRKLLARSALLILWIIVNHRYMMSL